MAMVDDTIRATCSSRSLSRVSPGRIWRCMVSSFQSCGITAKISFYMRLKRFSSCGLWARSDAIIDCGTLVGERMVGLDAPISQIETNDLMN